jgi:hypothetical protein
MDQNRRIWYASFAAGFIGLVAGLIVTGPHMHEWTPSSVVLIPLGGGILGVVFGVVLGVMATSKKDFNSSAADGPSDPTGPFGGLGASRGALDHSDSDQDAGHE